MPLTQDATLTRSADQVTGQTLGVHLHIGNGQVKLAYVAQPSNILLTQETADVGSGAATTLLSYFDTATGELTGTGETHAKTLSVGGYGGTIDTYFS